jgi:hypothetical protein
LHCRRPEGLAFQESTSRLSRCADCAGLARKPALDGALDDAAGLPQGFDALNLFDKTANRFSLLTVELDHKRLLLVIAGTISRPTLVRHYLVKPVSE